MKICELCKSTARIYCDSDQANLCWDCDFKVHSANFLVAKHSRSLLCHVCQSPTPWNGSGRKLGRTISVCERCVDDYAAEEESQGGNDDEISSDDDDDDEGDSDGDFDEDGDNQVVPWSDSSPPPAASSSSSEVSSSRFCKGGGDICLKRLRENSLDPCSEDAVDSASSDKNIISPAAHVAAAAGCARAAFVDSYSRTPLKSQRAESNPPPPPPKVHQGLMASLRSAAIVQTVKRCRLKSQIVNRKSGEGRYNDRRDDDCDSSVSS